MKSYYAYFPLIVGALIPIQAKLNGKLYGFNQNAVFTSLISVLISGIIITIVYFSTTKQLPPMKTQWWIYAGGVFGALYLIGLGWVAAKVSTTQLVAGLLAGQMIMALLIDFLNNGRIGLNQIISAGLVIVAAVIKK